MSSLRDNDSGRAHDARIPKQLRPHAAIESHGASLNTLEFTAFVGAGALLAGFLGSLTGLGGGVVIVPLLTLVFGVDIRYAIGVALISVIATSSGAAAAYVREGYSNVRVAMFLEIATTVGALVGAKLVLHLHVSIISIIFGVVLLYSAYASITQHT